MRPNRRLGRGPHTSTNRPRGQRGRQMKRIALWVFYGIGMLAMLYLAFYAYAAFTGRNLQPGDPIHIFRKPDAPDYSAASNGAFA